MTKPKPKDDLFDATTGSTHGKIPEKAGRVAPPPKVQGGYTGTSSPNRKPPTTGSGVAPAKPRTAPAKPKRKPGTAVAIAPPAAPVNLLSLIGQALTNPAVDVVKLQGVIDWYDKREAKNAFDRDFLAMSGKLPEITRDGLIDQGTTRSGRQGVKSRYPKFESVHEAVGPTLREFGFSMSTRSAIFGEQTVVIVRLTHYDPRHGSYSEESVQPVRVDDSGGKTAVQAFASGEQYAIRRSVIKLLHLRSRDPRDRDLDGNDPAKVEAAETKKADEAKPINAAQLKELRAKIAATGGRITDARVCEKAGVETLETIPMAKLPDLYKALDNVIEASRG